MKVATAFELELLLLSYLEVGPSLPTRLGAQEHRHLFLVSGCWWDVGKN